MSQDDRLITVQDVYNTIREHLGMLDALWPEGERYGPRKVHIVELIDAIKLRLIQRAEKNAARSENGFERAAARITGVGHYKAPPEKELKPIPDAPPEAVSPMEQAHRDAQARMARNKT